MTSTAHKVSPTRRQIRELRRENARWPRELTPIDRHCWPSVLLLGRMPIAVLRNQGFLVQVYEAEDDVIRLSVCRTDWNEQQGSWAAEITWDELQRLKREAGYADRMAVEIFPEDAAVVNVANMRHLWVLPARLPFAWGTKAAGGAE